MQTQTEMDKYIKVWKNPLYRMRHHGQELWNSHRALFPVDIKSALDIGCGLGKMLPVWDNQGIDGHGVDIAINALDPAIKAAYAAKLHFQCLWEMDLGRHFDFGLCTDVMEHIPEDRVVDVLVSIAQHCDNVLFKIAHEFSSLDGEILHLTRRPAEWWEDLMNSIGGCAALVTMVPRSGQMDSVIKWEIAS